MDSDTVLLLLNRITGLALARQTPLIIIENPKYVAARIEKPRDPSSYPDILVATIGNVSVSFDGYCLSEMLDLYAELKSGLEAEEAIKADQTARLGALVHAAKSP